MSTTIQFKPLSTKSLKTAYRKKMLELREHQLKHNAEIELDFLVALKEKGRKLVIGPAILSLATFLSLINNGEGVFYFLFLITSFFGIILTVFSFYWFSNWFIAFKEVKNGKFQNYNISKILNIPNWSSLEVLSIEEDRWKAVKNISNGINNADEIQEVIQKWETGSKPIRVYDVRVLEEALIALGSLEKPLKQN